MNEHRKVIESFKEILRYCNKRFCDKCVFSDGQPGGYCVFSDMKLLDVEDRADELEKEETNANVECAANGGN